MDMQNTINTDVEANEQPTVLGKALELGLTLAQSDEFEAYMTARDTVDNDRDASSLLDNYSATEQMLSNLIEKGEGDGEQAKMLGETLDDLRSQIVDNEALSELAETQGRFQMLMAQVNQVIGQFINPPSESEGCGCDSGGCSSGGCASCSGCH